MRLADVEEFATLTAPGEARLGSRKCLAAAGTVVQVLGRPTRPEDKVPRTALFVRIVTGSCAGFELTIDEKVLPGIFARPWN